MLARGLPAAQCDSHGDTPLHLAALRGHADALHTLIEAVKASAKPGAKTDGVVEVLLARNSSGMVSSSPVD